MEGDLLSTLASTTSSMAGVSSGYHVDFFPGRDVSERMTTVSGDEKDNKGAHKSNQCVSKLGRGGGISVSTQDTATKLNQQQKKSSKYCVLLVIIMKVALSGVVAAVTPPLLSSSTVSVVLVLSQFSFGGKGGGGIAVQAENFGRTEQRHHFQDSHWQSAARNRNVPQGRRNEGHQYNSGEGQLTALDRVLKRLEGRGPTGRRERRDFTNEEVNDRDRMITGDSSAAGGPDGKVSPAEQDQPHNNHHYRSSPILPSSAVTTHPLRHRPPTSDYPSATQDGTTNYAAAANDRENPEDTSDEEEDDDDEDYEDDYHDSLTARTRDKTVNWADNYKSRYLADRRTRMGNTSTTTTSGTTTAWTTTTPEPSTSPPLTYSQWKWQNLGNRKGLEQYRRQMLANGNNMNNNNNNNNHHHSSSVVTTSNINHHSHHPHHHQSRQGNGSGRSRSDTSSSNSAQESSISEAIEHAMRMRTEAECRIPRPKVVYVQNLYPNPGKIYHPHCTILHQCSDDTGCCTLHTETCAARYTQTVEIAFYTVLADQSRDAIVERLVFENHTECECRDKMDEMMPRDQQSYHQVDPLPPPPPAPKRDSRVTTTTNLVAVDDRDKRKSSLCKCPSVFSRKPLPGNDNGCSCDCFDGQMDCLHLKRGREFFTLSDKWCIQSGHCEIPECAFGRYIHLIGKCPQKQDMDGDTTSWTKYMSS